MQKLCCLLLFTLYVCNYSQGQFYESEFSYVNPPDLTRKIDKTKPVYSIPANINVSNSAASYTVPIDIPEGINGLQPNISVGYNSQGGVGELGWAWHLKAGSKISMRRGNRALNETPSDFDLSQSDFDYLNNDYSLDGQALVYAVTADGDAPSTSVSYSTAVESFQTIRLIYSGNARRFDSYFEVVEKNLEHYDQLENMIFRF